MTVYSLTLVKMDHILWINTFRFPPAVLQAALPQLGQIALIVDAITEK